MMRAADVVMSRVLAPKTALARSKKEPPSEAPTHSDGGAPRPEGRDFFGCSTLPAVVRAGQRPKSDFCEYSQVVVAQDFVSISLEHVSICADRDLGEGPGWS